VVLLVVPVHPHPEVVIFLQVIDLLISLLLMKKIGDVINLRHNPSLSNRQLQQLQLHLRQLQLPLEVQLRPNGVEEVLLVALVVEASHPMNILLLQAPHLVSPCKLPQRPLLLPLKTLDNEGFRAEEEVP